MTRARRDDMSTNVFSVFHLLRDKTDNGMCKLYQFFFKQNKKTSYQFSPCCLIISANLSRFDKLIKFEFSLAQREFSSVSSRSKFVDARTTMAVAICRIIVVSLMLIQFACGHENSHSIKSDEVNSFIVGGRKVS